MAHVPSLRTPYTKVGRIVYFGRMLDKIRLHAAGKLPPDYVTNLGDSQPGFFDTHCCTFLGVKFSDVHSRTLAGGSDEEVLAWCEERGTNRSDQECHVWNSFMVKRGWRDISKSRLLQRVAEGGFQGKGVETFFDCIDCDEGRDPWMEKLWEKI